jgi:hypothetical protein
VPCSYRIHDRVIAHILPVGFFFIGFSIFVFFFAAAPASPELTTGRITAAPNAASTLAMRSFFTGGSPLLQHTRRSNILDS